MSHIKGLTLMETLVSLAILATIVGTLSPLFKNANSLLDRHRSLEEVLQNNRIVLRRLVKETRYANTVYTATTNLIEMGTIYLIDSDALEEKVRYRLQNGVLLRSVDTTGLGYGSEVTMAEKIQSFTVSYNSSEKTVTFQLTTTWNSKSYSSQAVSRLRAPS